MPNRQPSPLNLRRQLSGGLVLFAILLDFLFELSTAAEYEDGDLVPLWTNKIGPKSSPTESYAFYETLSWCRPETMQTRPLKLGEALSGDRVVKSPYKLPFTRTLQDVELCQIALNIEQVQRFVAAIQNGYFYELLLDDELPLKLSVGDAPTPQTQQLYTHINFEISFNGRHVIQATALPSNPMPLTLGSPTTVRFSYSTLWRTTDFPYKRRSDKYRDPGLERKKEIQWFGIINSLLSVLLLMGFFASILTRVVRRDVYIYANSEVEGEIADYGWKQVYGDVFRFPTARALLCPFLGTGLQLLVLSAVLLVLGAFEMFHPLSRGTLQSTILTVYAATAWIAGYSSGFAYKQMGGSAWIRNALMTVVVFCGPVAAVMGYLQTVALFYGSTRVFPMWTIGAVAVLWAVVTVPLTLLGAILGKNWSTPFPSPCGPTKIPREIPPCPWYRSSTFMILMSGLMPFSSIFLEIHALFGAIWGHRIFEIYEMLAIVFVLLILVTTITTIAAVYFQLSVEDYRWWWNSLLYGGSVGAYVLAYSMLYYYLRSPSEGFMQGSFFFGYSLLLSYAFFLQCGTVGFFAARWFVLFLYRSIKND